MKSEHKYKQCLVLLLCILAAMGLLVESAAAAPTGRCTNIVNEGIEYFTPITVYSTETNDWRTDLEALATFSSGGAPSGRISAIELEVVNNASRFQCTEITPGTPAIFSCNSIPNNAVISGIYIRYIPDTSVTENTLITFNIRQVTNGKVLYNKDDSVIYPPYPCGRNFDPRDFIAYPDDILAYNTSASCTEHKEVRFLEQSSDFAIVNIIPGDFINSDRIKMSVTPAVHFDYTMRLTFEDSIGGLFDVEFRHEYDPALYPATGYNDTVDASLLHGLTNNTLPLKLVSGRILNIVPKETDLWGNPSYPTQVDYNIKFWYENLAGTPDYQNSIFHFERNMNVLFGPYCDSSAGGVKTGVATALYDPCQTSRQLFNISLKDPAGQGILIPHNQIECDDPMDVYHDYCTDVYALNPPIHDYSLDHATPALSNYNFVVRKCLDSSCASHTAANAFLYSITVSDAVSQATTYRSNGYVIPMRLYEDKSTLPVRPFAITGVQFMTEEPGTYVVLGFVDDNQIKAGDFGHYAVKFYLKVNKTDQVTTCYTLANNGYYRAYWNDCLSHAETQLMTFEHIPDKEIGWIRNSSGVGIHFPYVSELSYIPQKLQIASLNCSFTALTAAGQPGNGYCRPDDIYVPPYTRVEIQGGSFYLEARPSVDEYRVAYARTETMNISHLFFSVPVKACENVRRIPDTGISLRSPLKVNEKVNTSPDEATSFVFTGNSLRIPAIGLGMEIPIPIVHVYYEEGAENLQWDLSTLGNYVGELEGGAYLPYAGNSALTGHYYSQGVFKNLGNLNYGDEIIIFGNDGIKYTYRVVQKFLAQPDDVYEMFQQIGERSLTLVTCENYNLVTDEYERRQLIRATIDSTAPYVETW